MAASEGDLDVAENALERLASELGREKDKAVNETASGKRKPSFAPDAALGAKEVQELMDGWELELERAIVLAMHPKSKRFSPTSESFPVSSSIFFPSFEIAAAVWRIL